MKNIEDLVVAWEKSPYPSIKTSSYFPIYSKVFEHLRNKECTFIETGVLAGGSLFMWRKWLGEKARIIGIDLNPDAKKWEEHGFEIYIGDQGDGSFWRKLLPKIGQIDAFLDDGGHQSFQQITTISELLSHINNDCVVALEDTYTSFMNDFKSHGNNSFLEYAKDATDLITAKSFCLYQNRFPTLINKVCEEKFKNVFNISFFNGITVFDIKPSYCFKPEIIRNKQMDTPIKDFRHDGTKSTTIIWPHLFEETPTKINGS
jgi:hypothetical protein